MNKKLNCILIVDDNIPDNIFHKKIIARMDIALHVKEVHNGLEAMDFINSEFEELPELILLDINMPKMNGWEFLEVFHKLSDEDKSKVVIVFLTTSINPDDMLKAEKEPDVSGFYTKPLTESMIREIIERFFFDYNNDVV